MKFTQHNKEPTATHTVFKPKHTNTPSSHNSIPCGAAQLITHSLNTQRPFCSRAYCCMHLHVTHGPPAWVRSRYSRHRQQAVHLIQCLKITTVGEQGSSVSLCSHCITEPSKPKTRQVILESITLRFLQKGRNTTFFLT